MVHRGRRRLTALAATAVVLAGVVVLVVRPGSGPSRGSAGTRGHVPLAARGSGPGQLAVGSARQLPKNILVADRNNHRLLLITPHGQLAWTKAIAGPSDAYLSPDKRSIVVTQHGGFAVVRLSVATGAITYHYGHYGHPGTADGYLHDPQTAQQLHNGELLIADKSNCRILFLSPPAHHPTRVLGATRVCVHDPPRTFSYTTSAFPTASGGLIVSAVTPPAIDLLSANGSLRRTLRPAGLAAPYDANEFAADRIVATSHSRRGAVEELTTSGTVLWRFGPAKGPGALELPSLAQVLPDGVCSCATPVTTGLS